MSSLSSLIKIQRRYYRSVNLERDLEIADSIQGYIPTPKVLDALDRFLNSYSSPHSIRAWTITGVYGTGKSAFAHFLTALCAPASNQVSKNAFSILRKAGVREKKLGNTIRAEFPEKGLVRAVVTAQREPVATTIVRGLTRSATGFWGKKRGAKPHVLKELLKIDARITSGERIDNRTILDVIQKVGAVAKSGVVIVIDELGKNLEYTAQSQSVDDLYLLQQIAELPSGPKDPKVFLFGLLHQSFADYAHGLTASQRNEWTKIQGRFEDIPLIGSSEQAIRLIGQSIEHTSSKPFLAKLKSFSKDWYTSLSANEVVRHLKAKDIELIYPLNPISALVLPGLCSRHAQNDRTLFTFLTSDEPHALQGFLRQSSSDHNLPTLKLDQIYDYFVEAAGVSISLRPQFQRWVEIQGCILDARHLEPDHLRALKTIGILNLMSTSGALKASHDFVVLALVDNPSSKSERKRWGAVINTLIEKKFVTWRKQIDELRIWEGSDFNIEEEVSKYIQADDSALAETLNNCCPLRPTVIQRHSYETGTLRYFARLFVDRHTNLENLLLSIKEYDGVILYWIGQNNENPVLPIATQENKPVVAIIGAKQKPLRLACNEYVALDTIFKTAPHLRSDGIAKREVRQRATYAKQVLDRAVESSFDVKDSEVTCIVAGKDNSFYSNAAFASSLSDECDETYKKGIKLWNELINRKRLTTQGAKARRLLLEAMINNSGKERFGLEGYGPEVSICESLLVETGMYCCVDGNWQIATPKKSSGVYAVWSKIESFCKGAQDSPEPIDKLYAALKVPPYGLREEVIPILLLSVILQHGDNMSLFMDGTFVPIVTAAHTELLVKKPSMFSIKYFEIKGVRSKLFEALEGIFQKSSTNKVERNKNATLLGIVKPLVRFVSILPKYTLQTVNISNEAQATRKALVEAKRPDELLFKVLPEALGLSSIDTNSGDVKEYRKRLTRALIELQEAYDSLLKRCNTLLGDSLGDAFYAGGDKSDLRENLCASARLLVGHSLEPQLQRFINAATNENSSDKDWLEPILMVIADKPADCWREEDELTFQIKLGDVARKFVNLDLLYREMARHKGDGFTAQRLTLTNPDGSEFACVVCVDSEEKKNMERLAQKLLDDDSLKDNEKLQLSLIATLVEKIMPQQKKTDKTSLKIADGETKVG